MKIRKTLFVCLLAIACDAVTISTDHVDTSRLSWNNSETILTPSVVSVPGRFGITGSYAVDGAVWAGIDYVPAVTIGGVSHNIVIVATMHNSIYAFDADKPGSSPLWHAGPLATSWSAYPTVSNFLYGGELGCLATPAVDVSGSVVYAICASSVPAWTIYKINLITGVTVSSVVVSASVAGSGDPSGGDCVSGGIVSFCASLEMARAGLTLANNLIYASFGAYNDSTTSWHGWVISYDSSLTEQAAFCTTPNGHGGSIWQASGGLAVDGSGNLYAATGNGDFSSTSNNYANSVIKLASNLTLADYFTPTNWATLSAGDLDLSSGRVMLPPGAGIVVVGAKDYNVYSINTSCMGHLGGTSGGCTAPQIFITLNGTTSHGSGVFGGMFMNGVGYFPVNNFNLYTFTLSGSTWNVTPVVSSLGVTISTAMTGTSNGASSGIAWTLVFPSGSFSTANSAVLHALDPSALTDYWLSTTFASDVLGTTPKYVPPTVANGRVYVPQLSSTVLVYGLLPYGPSSTGGNSLTGGAVLN